MAPREPRRASAAEPGARSVRRRTAPHCSVTAGTRRHLVFATNKCRNSPWHACRDESPQRRRSLERCGTVDFAISHPIDRRLLGGSHTIARDGSSCDAISQKVRIGRGSRHFQQASDQSSRTSRTRGISNRLTGTDAWWECHEITGVTRSKELRRIERAIADLNMSELRWALPECELRQRHSTRHSARWYQLEKRIRVALAEVEGESN